MPAHTGSLSASDHTAPGRIVLSGPIRADDRHRSARTEDECGETTMREMETQSCGHKFLGRPTKEAGCHGLILFPVKDSREAPSPPGWNLEDRHDGGREESRERARDPRLHVAFLGAYHVEGHDVSSWSRDVEFVGPALSPTMTANSLRHQLRLP